MVSEAEQYGTLPDFSSVGVSWAQDVADGMKGAILDMFNQNMMDTLKHSILQPYFDQMATGDSFSLSSMQQVFTDIDSSMSSFVQIGQGLADIEGYVTATGSLGGFDWGGWQAKYGQDWENMQSSMVSSASIQEVASGKLEIAADKFSLVVDKLDAVLDGITPDIPEVQFA